MNELLREAFSLPAGHPVFAGHFPARPIVPGALLLDEVLRLAQPFGEGKQWRCRSAKFVKPAGPGQQLSIVLVRAAQPGQIDFRIESAAGAIASGSLLSVEGAA